MKRVIMAAVVVLGLASTANAGPVYSGAKAAGKGAVVVAKATAHGATAVGRYIGRVARVL